MRDLDRNVKDVIDRFALLIKQIIQKNLHRGDGIELEDIEQEVRFKIWTFIKKGKKIDNLPSYIKRVAYSTTIDELRKMMKQRPALEPDVRTEIAAESGRGWARVREFSPEARLEDHERREAIQALVDTLSENRKQVLRLFLAGMTIEDISLSLNWDKTRVRHFFYRGIADLKELSRAGQADDARNRPGGLDQEAKS